MFSFENFKSLSTCFIKILYDREQTHLRLMFPHEVDLDSLAICFIQISYIFTAFTIDKRPFKGIKKNFACKFVFSFEKVNCNEQGIDCTLV